jgi:hypothetical protein
VVARPLSSLAVGAMVSVSYALPLSGELLQPGLREG